MKEINIKSIKVTGGNLLVKAPEKNNEVDNIIVDTKDDLFFAEVVAVGFLVEDIKVGDIVASPNFGKIKVFIEGEKFYLVDYSRVTFFV